MSATSGITVSPELSEAFGNALSSQSVRFLKISIRNESLVVDQSVPPSGTLQQDLDTLPDILEESVPAYVLVRLDDPPTEWLLVSYVPDDSKVRDKMLYASTRNNLTKSLGSAPFTDSIFATSKADVGAEAYKRHRASLAAPKPMTAREKEMEEIKAAESRSVSYEGSKARRTHLGGRVGFQWTSETEQAVKGLGEQEWQQGKLVVLSVDPSTETLVLSSQEECDAYSGLAKHLPRSDPAFALYAWKPNGRGERYIANVVFVYSCPSGSPIKHRMLYSSGMLVVYHHAKTLLQSTPVKLVQRKIETADPQELDAIYMRRFEDEEFHRTSSATATPAQDEQKPMFARPKGPARKR